MIKHNSNEEIWKLVSKHWVYKFCSKDVEKQSAIDEQIFLSIYIETFT